MTIASATATVLTALISALAGLGGVVVGSWAASRREHAARRQSADAALNKAALMCLARVNKIARAESIAAENVRMGEIDKLGGDIDNYVAAAAAVEDGHARARHLKICDAAMPTLTDHSTDNLAAVRDALEQFRNELLTP
jgi:hypothetical protein